MLKKGLFSMNILLVNHDVVVTKLVKLSTQKTGDRLDIATSLDEIRDESYDLLILDGGLFSREFLEGLNDKVLYAHSIFITTRERVETAFFEKLLYKPFLPTELLLMLHQVAAIVQKEQEELSKEIVFDDFENSFFSDDEIAGADDATEQDSFEHIAQVEKVEALSEAMTDAPREDEVLDNIFSHEDVSEVKAILDALNSEEKVDEPVAQAVIEESAPLPTVDEELERALQNLSEANLSVDEIEDVVMPVDEVSTEELSLPQTKESSTSSKQNQESIETLRTLLKALENPQLARSLRGTITINLTFGED